MNAPTLLLAAAILLLIWGMWQGVNRRLGAVLCICSALAVIAGLLAFFS